MSDVNLSEKNKIEMFFMKVFKLVYMLFALPIGGVLYSINSIYILGFICWGYTFLGVFLMMFWAWVVNPLTTYFSKR